MKYLKENKDNYIKYTTYGEYSSDYHNLDFNINEFNAIFNIFTTKINHQTTIQIKSSTFFISDKFKEIYITKSSDDYYLIKVYYNNSRESHFYKCDQIRGLKSCIKNLK